ncbi:hypothetical protein SCFA_200007 [anaerobic digester metagenome]|uniref:Uncharacterized protein n=1 Tax=anaerobic digester metagenome TaxID=1263854 RepID=A0A485LXN3_9ZZZZ
MHSRVCQCQARFALAFSSIDTLSAHAVGESGRRQKDLGKKRLFSEAQGPQSKVRKIVDTTEASASFHISVISMGSSEILKLVISNSHRFLFVWPCLLEHQSESIIFSRDGRKGQKAYLTA